MYDTYDPWSYLDGLKNQLITRGPPSCILFSHVCKLLPLPYRVPVDGAFSPLYYHLGPVGYAASENLEVIKICRGDLLGMNPRIIYCGLPRPNRGFFVPAADASDFFQPFSWPNGNEIRSFRYMPWICRYHRHEAYPPHGSSWWFQNEIRHGILSQATFTTEIWWEEIDTGLVIFIKQSLQSWLQRANKIVPVKQQGLGPRQR